MKVSGPHAIGTEYIRWVLGIHLGHNRSHYSKSAGHHGMGPVGVAAPLAGGRQGCPRPPWTITDGGWKGSLGPSHIMAIAVPPGGFYLSLMQPVCPDTPTFAHFDDCCFTSNSFFKSDATHMSRWLPSNRRWLPTNHRRLPLQLPSVTLKRPEVRACHGSCREYTSPPPPPPPHTRPSPLRRQDQGGGEEAAPHGQRRTIAVGGRS